MGGTHRNISLNGSEPVSPATVARLERGAGVSGPHPGRLVHTPARLLPVHRLVGTLDLVPLSQIRAFRDREVFQHHT